MDRICRAQGHVTPATLALPLGSWGGEGFKRLEPVDDCRYLIATGLRRMNQKLTERYRVTGIQRCSVCHIQRVGNPHYPTPEGSGLEEIPSSSRPSKRIDPRSSSSDVTSGSLLKVDFGEQRCDDTHTNIAVWVGDRSNDILLNSDAATSAVPDICVRRRGLPGRAGLPGKLQFPRRGFLLNRVLDSTTPLTMPPRKTPTSSLPGSRAAYSSLFNLIMTAASVVNLIRYRTRALTRWVLSGGPFLKPSTTPSSPATRLPLELVEMIIAYLIYDTPSLRACTLTCYSWYIAAVPHLHYILIISDSWGQKFQWPNPLRHMHTLGLLPFVKTLWVSKFHNRAFSPKWFNRYTRHRFSALNNVQRLMMDYLDIPSFMPRIRQYFGHFMPTVEELCLENPIGSSRQIIYFIGLFERLESLNLNYNRFDFEEPPDDLMLFPPFVPPLWGWLKLRSIRRVGVLKDMIDLFGGLRFHLMDLSDVDGMPLLLHACAETLETLQLNPTDPRGEQLPQKDAHISTNSSAVSSSLRDFDLSRNKSLRALQFMASSIDGVSRDAASSFLNHILSTIQSPVFSQVAIIHAWSDFRGAESWQYPRRPPLREISQAERAEEVSWHRGRFEVFRGFQSARGLLLQSCVWVWDPLRDYAVGILEEAVVEEKTKGGFDGILSQPLVTYISKRCRLGE